MIQYLDDELTKSEKETIETHLSQCDSCRKAMAEMREKVACVKKDLSLLNPDKVDIPLFIYQKGTQKQKHIHKVLRPAFIFSTNSYTWIKKLAIPLAAIFILWIVVTVYNRFFERKSDTIPAETILQDLDEIIVTNPNEWWTDRRLIIIIIDEDKKTVERIITSKNEDDVIREVTHFQ